jgi:hypothetical protein
MWKTISRPGMRHRPWAPQPDLAIEVRGEYNLSEEGLFQDRVRERDLDNFLVEELHSSDTFRLCYWLG